MESLFDYGRWKKINNTFHLNLKRKKENNKNLLDFLLYLIIICYMVGVPFLLPLYAPLLKGGTIPGVFNTWAFFI
jgi:hypothetical protein